MAESDAIETESAGRSARRYLWIALPLIVAAAVLFFLFKDEIEIRGWINRLSSADGRVRLEQREALKAHEDRDLVNRLLAEAVADEGKTFDVRMICANLLIEGQRLNVLERTFRDGSIHTRGVVLKAFTNEKWFDTFVADNRALVEQTILGWLEKKGDPTRSHALQIASKLGFDEVVPFLLPILQEPVDPSIHPRSRRILLIAAAGAAERFANCEAMPRIADLARNHGDALVRLRCMQVVERAMYGRRPEPACPDAVPGDTIGAVVSAALEDEDRSVRMGALLILVRHLEWARKLEPRLQALLDDATRKPAERRHALDVLAAVASPAFIERYPAYFHDPAPEIRSTASRAAATIEDTPLAGCLIGVVDRETENESMWIDALQSLRKAAGSWVGLPQDVTKYAVPSEMEFKKHLHTLFVRGEIEGATRQSLVEALFRWWCGLLGLDEATTKKALAARTAFWTAAAKGDVDAADAALNTVGTDRPGLFTYERGWLLQRTAK